jgi:endonuclease YncB( thermonuclease family)
MINQYETLPVEGGSVFSAKGGSLEGGHPRPSGLSAALCISVLLYTALPRTVWAAAPCAAEDGGSGTVVEVLNAETLLLDDSRVIRLMGALPPRFAAQYASHGGIALDLRPELKTALARLALGKRVQVRFGGSHEDRYGKQLAQVYVEPEKKGSADDSGQGLWLQGAMIGAGLATAYSFSDNRACARELEERERKAREQGEGYWRNGIFRVRAADNPKLLLGLVDTFQIVEGVVTTTADMGGHVYINFGADYHNDFTVSIEKKDRASFSGAAGALAPAGERGKNRSPLDGLKGKRLRVRGWIESYNGPMIAVSHPEQIEIDGETAANGEGGAKPK